MSVCADEGKKDRPAIVQHLGRFVGGFAGFAARLGQRCGRPSGGGNSKEPLARGAEVDHVIPSPVGGLRGYLARPANRLAARAIHANPSQLAACHEADPVAVGKAIQAVAEELRSSGRSYYP